MMCPNENVTCLTLTEYAQQSLEAVRISNITLSFAPGNHHLGLKLSVKSINDLSIKVQVAGLNSSTFPIAIVECAYLGFAFEHISEVSISGLEFNGCRENAVRSVDQFRLEGCRFHTGHGIELERIKNATIERSSFFSLTGQKTEVTFPWETEIVYTVGGAIITKLSTVVINECQVDRNTAEVGGSIYSEDSDVEINMSDFTNNSAGWGGGGVIYSSSANITIHNSTIYNNRAGDEGGIINAYRGIITINSSTFDYNRADWRGGVVNADSAVISINNSTFDNNTMISSNSYGGVLRASKSDVLLNDCIFNNNTVLFQGGIIWIDAATLTSNGYLQITNNRAALTGIVFAIWSTLSFSGNTTISNNYYGSLYLLLSHLTITFDGFTSIINNFYVATSLNQSDADLPQPNDIIFRGTVDLTYNYLYNRPRSSELENKIYIYIFSDSTLYIPNSHNVALYSGRECAYQSLLNSKDETNVTATGDSITDTKGEGVYSVVTSSRIYFSRPPPEPFRLCFCRNGQQDCSIDSPPNIQLKKGQTLKVSLVAVDQENDPVPQALSAFLLSRDGRLGEGQAIQTTSFACKEFEYTIFSPHDSDQLVLNAYGPCSNVGTSQTRISVEFLPCDCPIGFDVSPELSSCVCDCHPDIYPEHITNCSIGNESLHRRDNKWITYINTSSQEGYLIHPHCPFDYCRPSTEQVWINLNVINGTDAQCAFHRSGKLCGSCEDNLSLSLGSSRCMPCSNNWLALLIVFAIAGVVLVAFLLVCNLTVAVGTINGLILYANILTTNRAIFFPFDTPNFFTVFIAWLNLDLGFVTCFYDGMDGYAKTWLQLVFPLYIISMVAMVIIGCEYSTQIARIFTKTHPVATLATLILLSYTKSLRLIIAALSSATLEYPDGSREIVWLTDANIHYFEGKHIPLFLVALLILLVGIAYTLFLFFYQWLLRCSYNRALKWIRSARFYPFMDAYHGPYSEKYRYWTGILLFVRAFLYVGVALNVSGDPSLNLLMISCTLLGICLLKMLLPARVYNSWPLDALENSFIFNLLIFSVATLYIRETGGNQAALAYTSTSIAFFIFLIILFYHTYAFFLPKKLRNKLDFIKCRKSPPDEDNDDTYNIKPAQENKCTYSVVDPIPPLHKTADHEMEALCEAKLMEEEKTDPELKCPSLENGSNSPTLISSKDASQNRTCTRGSGVKIECQVDIELTGQNEMDSKDEQYSKANGKDCESKSSHFNDPYIADNDQRGMERETEIDDFIQVTQ